MNNAVFQKTMENIRKCRDIKLVRKNRRKTYLVSEHNYYTTKIVFRKFINNRNEKYNRKNKNE